MLYPLGAARRVWLLSLVGTLLAGCHDGEDHGLGSACAETSPCRAPLVCVAGACTLPDAAADMGAETSSDGSSDAEDRGPSPLNQDAGSDDAPKDAAPDAGDDGLDDRSADATDGGSDASSLDTSDHASEGDAPDAADDGQDAAGGDAPDDAADGSGAGGSSPDSLPDATSSETGSATDAGPKGDPNRPAVLHVFATTDNGGLWLVSAPLSSLNGPTGHAGPVDVSSRAGTIGPLDDVEAQSIADQVNALARQGSNLFATSFVDQIWRPWVKVASNVSAMSLANVSGTLWACLASSTGRLRLMVRQNDEWQDIGDVMGDASIAAGLGEAPAVLSKLDCVGAGDDLQIFALDAGGELWHATKTVTRWIPFRRMQEASGLGLRDIDAANAVGEIHLIASAQTTQYHGVFDANGSFASFNDIELFHNDPQGEIRAGAATSMLAELELFQITSLGEIWISSRYRDTLWNYAKYVDRAPDDSRFVAGSATVVLPY